MSAQAMWRTAILGVALALATAGCAGSAPPLLASGTPPGPPYRGPLSVPVAEKGSVLERSGAAGRALDCDGAPYGGGTAAYDDGLLDVSGDWQDAVEKFFGPNSYPGGLPRSGYRIERRTGNRVLLSWDVAARTKVAIVAFDGIRDYQHHTGWGVETWAQCDPAEFPPDVAEDLGIGVWRDRHGDPVPITDVQAFPGQDWCGFRRTELLQVGTSPRGLFVRDPAGVARKYLRVSYDGSATVPAGATDTGWRRDGRELWLSPHGEAVYLVALDDRTDVERWPAFKQFYGCD